MRGTAAALDGGALGASELADALDELAACDGGGGDDLSHALAATLMTRIPISKPRIRRD